MIPLPAKRGSTLLLALDVCGLTVILPCAAGRRRRDLVVLGRCGFRGNTVLASGRLLKCMARIDWKRANFASKASSARLYIWSMLRYACFFFFFFLFRLILPLLASPVRGRASLTRTTGTPLLSTSTYESQRLSSRRFTCEIFDCGRSWHNLTACS